MIIGDVMEDKKNLLDGIMEEDLEKTSSFTDIMSRSEKRNLKKLKAQDQLEQTEKMDKIKEILKENEEYKKEYEKKQKQGKTKKEEPKIEKKKIEEPIKKEEMKKEEMKKEETNPPKEKVSKWKILGGILLLLIALAIGGFLSYQCFYLKEYGKKELLANASLLAPLFFASISCFSKGKLGKISRVFCYITLVLAILITFAMKFGYLKFPKTTLPDFTGKELTEVMNYTKAHGITLEQTYEFSDQIEEFHIISQDKKEGTSLKDLKELMVTVSSGPNYEKEVIVPNFVGQNIDEALKTLDENHFNHITVNFTFNDEIKRDIIMTQNVTGSQKRNTEIILEVSLGKEEDLEPVSMIDLSNKSLFEATLFLKRNGIPYDLQYEFSDKVLKNHVISQNVKTGTMINHKDSKVTLVISKGSQIKVPNLKAMTMEEVMKWVTDNHLKLEFSDRYDASIELGKIIEANYKEGDMIEEGTVIKIVTSKGQLKMKEFSDINDFRNWANKYGIKYIEEYEFNESVEEGNIISIDVPANSVINPNEVIHVKISSGSSVTIPNFIGMSRSSAENRCNSLGLNCSFYYENSYDSYNTVTDQNKRSGSVVVKGTYVRIYLSNGEAPYEPTPEPDPEPQPEPTPSCDTSKGTYFYIAPGGTGSQTLSATKNQNPGFNINATFVNQCDNGSTTSGSVCNAYSYDSEWISYCTTINLVIVN